MQFVEPTFDHIVVAFSASFGFSWSRLAARGCMFKGSKLFIPLIALILQKIFLDYLPNCF